MTGLKATSQRCWHYSGLMATWTAWNILQIVITLLSWLVLSMKTLLHIPKTLIGKIKSCLFSTGKVPANCSSVDIILLPCLARYPSFQYALRLDFKKVNVGQGLHIDTSEIKSEIRMLCNADLVTENNIPRHCEI